MAYVVLAALVLASSIVGLALVIAARRQAAPGRDLAQAVDLLGQVLGADAVMPVLPSHTKDEIAQFIRRYHKGLTR